MAVEEALSFRAQRNHAWSPSKDMLVGKNALVVLDLALKAVNNSVGLECDW